MSEECLVVMVSADRGAAVIERLREEGLLAERYRIENEGDMVAIPVTERPRDISVASVTDREMTPKAGRTLQERLRQETDLDQAALETVPRSWAVIGKVILADFEGCVERETVGDVLLDLHGQAHTVCHRDSIRGDHREPAVEIIAGDGETETIHTEGGTKYALDVAKVMFSPGNKAERQRMGSLVEEGTTVLDMFAGIGYFTLPMARGGAQVTAIERNPTAFRYLLENAALNGVEDRIRPYRGDCRTITDALTGETFELVQMGYFDAYEYLEAGVAMVASGGQIALHTAAPVGKFPTRAIERLEAAVSDRTVTIDATRIVKSIDEGVVHGVVVATLE